MQGGDRQVLALLESGKNVVSTLSYFCPALAGSMSEERPLSEARARGYGDAYDVKRVVVATDTFTGHRVHMILFVDQPLDDATLEFSFQCHYETMERRSKKRLRVRKRRN